MPPARRPNWLTFSPSVQSARKGRRPLVALETAVLTHGLPPAERLPLATQLRSEVEHAGAVPAFIALLKGAVRVGLEPRELKMLSAEPAAAKCALADLGWLVAQKATAGTTVSSTLHVAAAAGIDVAATGGIGGVHRDATDTFDISADLIELARAPVALVCSGAKIIVDLRKTLEFLESLSVPVIGFGTKEFPGFLVRETGLSLRAVARNLDELARAVRSYRTTGYEGGILVANPIPTEHALPRRTVERLVRHSLRRAAQRGVTGAALTPFLLAEMNRQSRGATLRANLALLRANAALAARLAVRLRRP